MTGDFRTVDLARAVGLGVQQVRNYEAWGFLPVAARSAAGYRLYTPRHLDALRTARTLIVGYGWRRALEVMRAIHAGDRDAALSTVDARHAELDTDRRRISETLDALQLLASRSSERPGRGGAGTLRVGQAARRVGVRASAVRYWEQRGLLSPPRDATSRYRAYDEEQMRRLRVVALLREVGHEFEVIASVLDEMASGRPARALEAVEARRDDVARASRACAEATATLWGYASRTAAWASGEGPR